MIYANENDVNGIGDVLTDLQQYIPYAEVNGKRVYAQQGFFGDQLSVERAVNHLFQQMNGFTSEERKEGMHLEVADWHFGVKINQVNTKF